ncbi:arylsulfatase [Arachidicoccus soli]|uniref:Arylsulfatase n=1 Tax=Arachidicoccus soli TaxID=2341117 RepID=A0A386HQ08_9BACT|nr:arylsulfatase [Arachidicoccus soli]AYD47521.1 arylsulfatase [Arachidicoccus soli]
MMRKICLMGVLFVSTYAQCWSQKNIASKKPNIILILADDMGFSDLNCYGGVKTQTPNINKLASEGIRFTQFYNNAWCSPTRASLLTGLYPQQVGMGQLANAKEGPTGPYQGYLSNNCVTLAEVLKLAGYNTLMSGKWHVGEAPSHWPIQRGFDHYFGLISGAANYFDITKTKIDTSISKQKLVRHMAIDGKPYFPPKKGFYMTQAITSHALQMLDDYGQKDKPFFLYLAYTAPHWPLQALPEDIARFKGAFNEGWDSLREERYLRQLRLGIIPDDRKLSPRDKEVPNWSSLSSKEQKEMAEKMAVYAAQIYRMDAGIGEVLQKLQSLRKEDNTIVIFMSDNGASAEGGIWGFDSRHNGLPAGGVDSYMSYGQSWANMSNTPFQYYKTWLHEGGISAPLIVKWPNVIAKKRDGSIIKQTPALSGHVIDIMPTLCEIAGASYPKFYRGKKILPLEGNSLLPIIKEDKKRDRLQPLYWALNGHKAMLMGNWKIVTAKMSAPWELYNIQNDRSELNNLAHKYPDKVKKMAAMWQTWANRVGVFKGQENLWQSKGGE